MSRRPGTVVAAVVGVLVFAISTLVSTVRYLVVGAARPDATVLGLPHRIGVAVLVGRLVVVVIDLALAALVWRGSRGARLVLTAWATLGVLAFVLGLVRQGMASLGWFAVVAVVLNAAVLVLLWLPPSRRWFGESGLDQGSIRPAGPDLERRAP